ncbi:hypothetical protein BAZSYMA_ACONTIG195440_1 [Bathymodiolus azoricus thioautotrophic gill symbiont]|uniref:Uncharacterized protein n=1 Tax=Bathymodiolus azoricus thioautotrophic gill symbiont TaxID=235205 RepID=A0A1H6KTE7_9GAMM|nr:hypothetical protein BAZSYMA_ACONTIG195440_1 [Bathymodiolus azoricus thioautotrophic gill symbiont]
MSTAHPLLSCILNKLHFTLSLKTASIVCNREVKKYNHPKYIYKLYFPSGTTMNSPLALLVDRTSKGKAEKPIGLLG